MRVTTGLSVGVGPPDPNNRQGARAVALVKFTKMTQKLLVVVDGGMAITDTLKDHARRRFASQMFLQPDRLDGAQG